MVEVVLIGCIGEKYDMANVQIDTPVSEAAGKIKNKELLQWVEEVAALCKPESFLPG